MTGSGQRCLAGLIGTGIEESLSPALHEREADQLGIRYLYQNLDIDMLGIPAAEVGTVVGEARRLGFTGLNITHPCKQLVIPALDRLAPEAAQIGAVNTITFSVDGATGHNTDMFGFRENFVRGLPGAVTGEVVLLGAGGAGAAVAYALLSLGTARVTIHDIAEQPARTLALALQLRFGAERARAVMTNELDPAVRSAHGVVNATPVGMTAHPGMPVDPGLLGAHHWVADIVYRPLETALLRAARSKGCRVLDGGGMAVFQALEAFRLFTGRLPDASRMLAHFKELVAAEDLGTGTTANTNGRRGDMSHPVVTAGPTLETEGREA